MANNLNTSGLTLNTTTFNSMDITDDNIQSILDVSRWSSLPKWSEVATATSGDIVIPECIVDVSDFSNKYKDSTITSFKTGILLECNKVASMYYMFRNCSSLTSTDLSNFDTSGVVDMGSMFHSCSSLTSIDLSNFDTSGVVDMSEMFYGCSSLTSIDLSNFNTSKVGNMNRMFYNCSKLASLNLSNFNTNKVTDMGYMFRGCSSLTSLDLSNFDTSKVTNTDSIFYNCSSLANLTLSSNWGARLATVSNSGSRTLNLSTTAITKAVANDVLSKLANVTGGTYKPIVKFKSSLGLSASEIAVGANKGWDVQTV